MRAAHRFSYEAQSMKRLIIVAAAFAVACNESTDPLAGNPSGILGGNGANGGNGGVGAGVSGEVRCVGTLSGTFDNNVIVRVGETCTLQNSTVKGNVKALENARLFMSNNHVRGNVQ